MLVNMEMLAVMAKDLDPELSPHPKIQRRIRQVRLLHKDILCRDDTLYLLDASDTSLLEHIDSAAQFSFAVIQSVGSSADLHLLSNTWDYLLFKTKDTPMDVMEKLTDRIIQLSKWYEELVNAVLSERDLDRLMQIAARPFANPIALFDISTYLLSWAGPLHEPISDPLWKSIIEENSSMSVTIPADEFMALYKSGQQPGVHVVPSLEKADAFHYMRGMLLHEGSFIAALGMNEVNEPFTLLDYYLLDILTDLLGRSGALLDRLALSEQQTSTVFSRLLKGQAIAEEAFREFIIQQRWKDNQPYWICLFEGDEGISINAQNYRMFTNRLESAFPSLRIFFHEKRLVGFSQDKHLIDKMNANSSVLLRMNLFCGISMGYCGFANMHYALEQASAALRPLSSKRSRIVGYSEICKDYIYAVLSDAGSLRHYCHPALLALCDGDPWHRELLNTVLHYLRNGKRISSTADLLGIHRNSLVNRLHGIYLRTGIDLDDLDESQGLFVQFSAEVLVSDISLEE